MSQQRFDIAQVKLWGELVGVVAMNNGIVNFQYTQEWIDKGVELSPLLVPLSDKVYSFPELKSVDAFHGLPGFLADALPDQFGNSIARKHFESTGRIFADLSPVERLLYMGNQAMGALEFEPAFESTKKKDTGDIIDVKILMEQSRQIVEGNLDGVTLAEMMRVGGSAGGARPKAVVLWDRQKETIRSGFTTPKAGEESWMIKFDGTGTFGAADKAPKPYNKIEYVYSEMARLAKLNMAETHVYAQEDYAHFMTKRFDRDGSVKHHVSSLGGLIHSDFNSPQTASYEQYLKTCQRLGLSTEEIKQAFRRCVFNIMGVNQDDHVKNFGFLMREGGRWELAPAYDLSFVKGRNWTKNHQLTLRGNADGDKVTNKELTEVAKQFGVDNPQEIIADVKDALMEWPNLAKAQGIPAEFIQTISHQHRLGLALKQTIKKGLKNES